jgi:YD repeat-containing protein
MGFPTSMKIIKFFPLFVLFVFGNTLIAICQGPPPAAISKGTKTGPVTEQKFVSLDGEFTIELPSQVSAFEGVRPVPNRSNGGSRYTWKTAAGLYFVEFISYVNPPAETIEHIRDTVERSASTLSSKGATIISKMEITVDGHPAIDLKYSNAGNTYVSRAVLARNKLYVLSTYWPDAESGESRIKILDSFRIIDGKAEIAKRLEAISPKPLPQTPATKRAKTDVQEELLKGHVKSVVKTEEYLDGTGSVGGIKNSGDEYFDESGNLVKQVVYDYRGNPDSITVYGFIDGKRVSKSGEMMDYEYNPPPAMASPPTASTVKPQSGKQVDSRYSQNFEYNYDGSGRLVEKRIYNNRAELSRKETYTYDGKNVTEVTTDKEGKVTFRILRVYDDNDNLVEQTYFSTSKAYPDDEKYTYKYLEFDVNGNWVKREERVKTAQYGGGTKELHSYEYRTITYY